MFETWATRPAREQDMPLLAEIYLNVRRETFLWVDPSHFSLEDLAVHTAGERLLDPDRTTQTDHVSSIVCALNVSPAAIG